jgi:hypothetical protein
VAPVASEQTRWGTDLVNSQPKRRRGRDRGYAAVRLLICAREVGRNLAESSLSILPTAKSESTKKLERPVQTAPATGRQCQHHAFPKAHRIQRLTPTRPPRLKVRLMQTPANAGQNDRHPPWPCRLDSLPIAGMYTRPLPIPALVLLLLVLLLLLPTFSPSTHVQAADPSSSAARTVPFVKGYSWGWTGRSGEYSAPETAESMGRLAATGADTVCRPSRCCVRGTLSHAHSRMG